MVQRSLLIIPYFLFALDQIKNVTTIRFPFMKVLNSCDGSFIEFSFAIPKRSKEKRILESHAFIFIHFHAVPINH